MRGRRVILVLHAHGHRVLPQAIGPPGVRLIPLRTLDPKGLAHLVRVHARVHRIGGRHPVVQGHPGDGLELGPRLIDVAQLRHHGVHLLGGRIGVQRGLDLGTGGIGVEPAQTPVHGDVELEDPHDGLQRLVLVALTPESVAREVLEGVRHPLQDIGDLVGVEHEGLRAVEASEPVRLLPSIGDRRAPLGQQSRSRIEVAGLSRLRNGDMAVAHTQPDAVPGIRVLDRRRVQARRRLGRILRS